MIYDTMDSRYVGYGESSTSPMSITPSRSSPVSLLSNPLFSEISIPAIAAHCLKEIDCYRRGELYTDTYGVELLRRATVANDQEAWACVQHCLSGVVRGWLHRHPKRAIACRLESEEHYIAQAFERFWQATALTQGVEFRRLSAALQYLRACLNGAILDTLRASTRPREVSLPEVATEGEPLLEELTSSSEVWEILQTVLSNEREQRLAYLLYQCGLRPREIGRFCPQEWGVVQEIYRLRRTILERFLRDADHL